jgi:lysophospholipase L1-like esterase
MSGTSTRLTRLAAALGAFALVVSGCSSGDALEASGGSASSSSSAPAGSTYQRYVALGDSFSSGPLIPTTDLAGGCARSDHNYPSLVAAELRVEDFVDVTCSGATTLDLTGVQRPFADSRIPPQLNALDKKTDLVTLGIGGNDFGLFATMVYTCSQLRSSDPTGAPCARRLSTTGPDLGAATDSISDRVATALQRIGERAPDATVVLVGYLRLAPASGTCPALPFATGDYAEARRISVALNRALARAAERAEATYVDMYAASRGHDICSSDPWVNGQTTDRQKALAYHPFAAGMQADAKQILAALRG